jgi:putative ubiquitin-RnfH superfamily antitoxin RatB of RatAB toxin-antitoxin module
MSNKSIERIAASLVYLSPQAQTLLSLQLVQGTTLSAAVLDSGILAQHQLSWPLPVGVFGQRIESPDTYIVQAGDRIELYRALTRDPKDVRRQRAERYPVGRRRGRR